MSHFCNVALSPNSDYLLLNTEKYMSAFDINSKNTQKKNYQHIYSFSWYPYQSSTEQSNCFLLTVKDYPLMLMNLDLSIRFTYKTNEVSTPVSAKFNYLANYIYCGLKRQVQIFDIGGSLLAEHKIQYGPVSDFTFSNDLGGLCTFGGHVLLFDERSSTNVYSNLYKNNGFSQLFIKDELLILVERNGNNIYVNDIRTMQNVYTIQRQAHTNQRLYTAVSNELCSGGTDGIVRKWSLVDGTLVFSNKVDSDTISAVQLSENGIFYSTGSRRFDNEYKYNPHVGFIDYGTGHSTHLAIDL